MFRSSVNRNWNIQIHSCFRPTFFFNPETVTSGQLRKCHKFLKINDYVFKILILDVYIPNLNQSSCRWFDTVDRKRKFTKINDKFLNDETFSPRYLRIFILCSTEMAKSKFAIVAHYGVVKLSPKVRKIHGYLVQVVGDSGKIFWISDEFMIPPVQNICTHPNN